MPHDHGHHQGHHQGHRLGHGHHHGAGPAGTLGAYRWAVGLNVAYVLVEIGAGLWAGSLALLADAAHNVTDVAGLLIAWLAAVLAGRAGTRSHTYGLGRATILAALANGAAILAGVVLVVWHAVERLSDPAEVPGGVVLAVSLIGVGINAGSALLFARAHAHDLNARGAFLHLVADAAVSGAVVVAAIGMIWTGWGWLDPAVAIGVSVVIAWSAWGLVREALHLGMDGVPRDIDMARLQRWLAARPGVTDVHDLHVWALSTTRSALSVHLVWQGADQDAFLRELDRELRAQFGIDHATVQIERAACAMAGAEGLCGTPALR